MNTQRFDDENLSYYEQDNSGVWNAECLRALSKRAMERHMHEQARARSRRDRRHNREMIICLAVYTLAVVGMTLLLAY